MSLPIHLPFRIKLCGFRRAADVEAAIEVGADAIGINFYPNSPRFVTPENAVPLIEAGRGRALMVGVFVNASVSTIRDTLRTCPLDLIQLHGDETPDLVIAQGLPPVIKAMAWREGNASDAANAASWILSTRQSKLAGILIDAYDPIQRGGTGRVARWDLLFPRPNELSGVPLILAGGLNASNVAEAIRVSRPEAVDTASGIEIEPGIKDRLKMQQFVTETVRGFESVR